MSNQRLPNQGAGGFAVALTVLGLCIPPLASGAGTRPATYALLSLGLTAARGRRTAEISVPGVTVSVVAEVHEQNARSLGLLSGAFGDTLTPGVATGDVLTFEFVV